MTENNKKDNNIDAELVARLQSALAENKSQEASKPGFKLNNNYIILAVLVLMVIVSGVQAAKLSSLGNGSTAPATSSSGSTGGTTLPDSLQNLPSQVGGC